ncbi:Pre-mRNA-splicing factor Cwf15/Cwc15 [Kalmanozyma brasiliensis GHG001]|uniref:Cwf15/Cwc15 cell cycle control protein n=1 Tax=Kalmanozyma brasiliensis (strain GHG001) TaxID=1365824 RepID=V5EVB6_KALBG|nr:Pre-mRNA-splicing factor Cwf15/Cwc15 [Kalmanozyma brasiliensis GHG001]EST09410.1 Pre-mRNA-splicing factor Cwf15/Cwc15 [Kalmanozyma brasiliensis GHG001]
MSTAHRPNWAAAKGRESKAHLSAQRTVQDIAQHTKLKFRAPAQASSTASGSESGGRRDLKRELESAEWAARNVKRAREGLEPLTRADEEVEGEEGKRRAAIQAALELDKDSDADSSSDDDDDDEEGKERSKSPSAGQIKEESDDGDESDSDEDSDEDEQALLLRELEKIRSERAAEKARLSALADSTTQLSREQEIAQGNPLLNLQHALHGSAASTTTEAEEGDFAVRKRWDHDVIFKNQAGAAGNTGGKGGSGFVNDLTRSDFHRKFMSRYIR